MLWNSGRSSSSSSGSQKLLKIKVTSHESELEFNISPKSTGKYLFDLVCSSIGLRETWYFGLQNYTSLHGHLHLSHWLRLDKKIIAQQQPNQRSLTYFFHVKFFPENIEQELIQGLTRHLFYLTVKAIVLDRLAGEAGDANLTDSLCPSLDVAIVLAALAAHAEYGDLSYSDDLPIDNGGNQTPSDQEEESAEKHELLHPPRHAGQNQSPASSSSRTSRGRQRTNHQSQQDRALTRRATTVVSCDSVRRPQLVTSDLQHSHRLSRSLDKDVEVSEQNGDGDGSESGEGQVAVGPSLLPTLLLQFVPSQLVSRMLSTPAVTRKLVACYNSFKGISRDRAELQYLTIAQANNLFGVDFFPIGCVRMKCPRMLLGWSRRYLACNELTTMWNGTGGGWSKSQQTNPTATTWLGVSAAGLQLYSQSQHNPPCYTFYWNAIKNVSYRERKFTIKLITNWRSKTLTNPGQASPQMTLPVSQFESTAKADRRHQGHSSHRPPVSPPKPTLPSSSTPLPIQSTSSRPRLYEDLDGERLSPIEASHDQKHLSPVGYHHHHVSSRHRGLDSSNSPKSSRNHPNLPSQSKTTTGSPHEHSESQQQQQINLIELWLANPGQAKSVMSMCTGNHALFIRRRQPDTVEVQQMRAQAREERLRREIERNRLERARTEKARAVETSLALEARCNELEQALKQQQKQQEPTGTSVAFLQENKVDGNDGEDDDDHVPNQLIQPPAHSFYTPSSGVTMDPWVAASSKCPQRPHAPRGAEVDRSSVWHGGLTVGEVGSVSSPTTPLTNRRRPPPAHRRQRIVDASLPELAVSSTASLKGHHHNSTWNELANPGLYRRQPSQPPQALSHYWSQPATTAYYNRPDGAAAAGIFDPYYYHPYYYYYSGHQLLYDNNQPHFYPPEPLTDYYYQTASEEAAFDHHNDDDGCPDCFYSGPITDVGSSSSYLYPPFHPSQPYSAMGEMIRGGMGVDLDQSSIRKESATSTSLFNCQSVPGNLPEQSNSSHPTADINNQDSGGDLGVNDYQLSSSLAALLSPQPGRHRRKFKPPPGVPSVDPGGANSRSSVRTGFSHQQDRHAWFAAAQYGTQGNLVSSPPSPFRRAASLGDNLPRRHNDGQPAWWMRQPPSMHHQAGRRRESTNQQRRRHLKQLLAAERVKFAALHSQFSRQLADIKSCLDVTRGHGGGSSLGFEYRDRREERENDKATVDTSLLSTKQPQRGDGDRQGEIRLDPAGASPEIPPSTIGGSALGVVTGPPPFNYEHLQPTPSQHSSSSPYLHATKQGPSMVGDPYYGGEPPHYLSGAPYYPSRQY